MRINAGDVASLLLADLQTAGWNGVNNSYPDQTIRQFAMSHLTKSITKKFLLEPSGTTPEGDDKALALFLKVNEGCRGFQLDAASRPSWVRTAIGEAKAFLYRFSFPPCGEPKDEGPWGSHERDLLTNSEIAMSFGVGPGSNLGAPETDFYSKFALSDMAASSSALHSLYVQAIRHNPTWLEMESSRAKRFGYTVAESSRLCFVPKTSEISRTICTEPVLNTIFQKGIASILETRLRQVIGINLKDQQFRNRRLARVGSLSGKFGTIDLSSASDSMSLSLVREFFPVPVVRWLERTSCRSTVLPDGRKIELHMISSMGNAFTFPLQTIFFAALVYGAYKAIGIPFDRPNKRADGNFAVFGDDIIVKSEAYDLVCELLSISGFTVNVDKSFNTGLFRESCGSDFYQGHNVRGVYIRKLADRQDCYSAINRLNRWSACHRVPLPRLVSYLSSRCRFLPIPFDEDDSAGIKVPFGFIFPKKRGKIHGTFQYRALVPIPRSYDVDASTSERKNKPRGFFENPSGQLIALLAGSVRNGRVGLRSNQRSTVLKRKYTPRWDYIPSDQVVIPGFDVVWKYYVEVNLM